MCSILWAPIHFSSGIWLYIYFEIKFYWNIFSLDKTVLPIRGIKITIQVIVIRVNLIVFSRICYPCHTHCIRFNLLSKIFSDIAEGFYILLFRLNLFIFMSLLQEHYFHHSNKSRIRLFKRVSGLYTLKQVGILKTYVHYNLVLRIWQIVF